MERSSLLSGAASFTFSYTSPRLSSTSSTKTYDLLSEPDANLFCAICLELASQPKQCGECGKLFCTKCIGINGRKPCPNCRTDNPEYFKDVKSRREINELLVICANSERGCQWTGTVGTSDDHIASCQFALVPCPNKCGEDKGAGELLLIRKHLDQHLKRRCPKRVYECPHCREMGTFASITEDHDQVCKKKIVACANRESGCSLSMERGKMKKHVSRYCEYSEVACVYESLGCGVRMLRKDREKHEKKDREKHLDLSLTTVRVLSETVRTLSKKEHQEEIVIQLPGYARLKENDKKFLSTPFYTHRGGYRMCICVYANGYYSEDAHVSVFIKLLEGDYDSQLRWPFLGTITIELLNQLEDGNHDSEVLTCETSDDMRVNNSVGFYKFISHSSLDHDPATNTQYLLDDTLYFRVSVEVDRPWLVSSNTNTLQA